jgi:hypothetical protein
MAGSLIVSCQADEHGARLPDVGEWHIVDTAAAEDDDEAPPFVEPTVGAPCTHDADCGSGQCLVDGDIYRTGGYCTSDCTLRDCREGTTCLVDDNGAWRRCYKDCATNSECREGQECFIPVAWSGWCIPIKYPDSHVYRISVTGEASATDSNGASWDPEGGLPDLGVSLSVNGEIVQTSRAGADDSITLVFSFDAVTIEKDGEDSVRILVFDEDGAGERNGVIANLNPWIHAARVWGEIDLDLGYLVAGLCDPCNLTSCTVRTEKLAE